MLKMKPRNVAHCSGALENDVIASKREAQHLAQRVLGHAGVALLAHERHRGLREADPDRHAAQEAVALGHRQQRVERLAVHQAEVAGLDGEVEARRGGGRCGRSRAAVTRLNAVSPSRCSRTA